MMEQQLRSRELFFGGLNDRLWFGINDGNKASLANDPTLRHGDNINGCAGVVLRKPGLGNELETREWHTQRHGSERAVPAGIYVSVVAGYILRDQ